MVPILNHFPFEDERKISKQNNIYIQPSFHFNIFPFNSTVYRITPFATHPFSRKDIQFHVYFFRIAFLINLHPHWNTIFYLVYTIPLWNRLSNTTNKSTLMLFHRESSHTNWNPFKLYKGWKKINQNKRIIACWLYIH